MNQHFDPYARNYAALSVKDLLDARNACHVQLSHSTNVFATAIGLYRIRDTDPDGKTYVAAKEVADLRGTLGPRTLENTVVQPWSWPCVLVSFRSSHFSTNAHTHGHDDSCPTHACRVRAPAG